LPPTALPDAKPSEEAPAATAKPVPHAETATGTQHDDAVAESVEPAVDRVAPRRTVEPAAATPASAGHTPAAAGPAGGTPPEGDGRVEGRVEVRADAVHAALYAQQDHARDALVAHRPALEAALGRSHLKLETFSVGVGQHELGDSDRRTPQSEPAHDEPGPRRPSSPSVAAAAPATTLTPAASGG